LSTRAETDLALPRRRTRPHFGDLALRAIAGAAALTVLIVLILIAYKVTQQAWDAISTFGLGFLTSSEWNAVTNSCRSVFWPLQFQPITADGLRCHRCGRIRRRDDRDNRI